MKEIIPPIKSQGIKTKLVNWINDIILNSNISLDSNWYEPFFGTGVVGFNSPLRGNFIVGDTNPYIIDFYSRIQSGEIDSNKIRLYLQDADKQLRAADEDGYAYYKLVRDRFNKEHSSYDFLFLSRAGFNGMMRFSRKGNWNIPFCKKPNRFAQSYITKICNQIDSVSRVIKSKNWSFNVSDFCDIIKCATKGDLIYCDPPYYGRYVDYYNGWTEKDEERLFCALNDTPAHFILSTWHHNDFRKNDMIDKYWSKFNVQTQEHFYHGGGKIENRHPIIEALVFNFDYKKKPEEIELSLFD